MIYSGVLGSTPLKVLVATGHSMFHVTWSVSIAPGQELIDPKVESIEWVENDWQDVTKTQWR